jgi:hypothetical protein
MLTAKIVKKATRDGRTVAELAKHATMSRSAFAARLVATMGNANAIVLAFRFGNGEFLSLWKDADDDIPILRTVHAEYAELT